MSQPENKESIYSVVIKRPVSVTMIALAFIFFGYLAMGTLPLNLMPDISYPTITIRTEYPGSAPEEVENSISKPIEQLVGVVNNLENVSSISKAGQSDVILEFSWQANIDQAMLDVREQLDRFFFDDAEPPRLLRYDPTQDPIMRLAIYRTDDLAKPRYQNDIDFLRQTRRFADEEIKRKLEVLPGVAAVRVKGGLEEEIRVQLDEQKLNLLNLNIRDITTRLSNENVNVAGGNIREGQTEYIVRTLNEFESLSDIRNIIIGYKNDGLIPIYLRDIGTVVRSYKDREIITRYKNRESVEIEIFKEANANIVDVADIIKQKVMGTSAQQEFVQNMRPGLPLRVVQQNTDFLAYELKDLDLGIDILSNQATFIESSVNEVSDAALYGGIFAIIILFLFLNDVKSTIIIGLTIPISILATFWPMDIIGISLNLMSLGGLALGIGMLVDNAIVVLESIYRCREEGDDFETSVIRGTEEVGSAVIASTLTTIAVFFPIVFVEGVAGQIFGDMATTVVFSLIASLAAAMFLIPMMASRTVHGVSVKTLTNQVAQKVQFKALRESIGQFGEDLSAVLERFKPGDRNVIQYLPRLIVTPFLLCLFLIYQFVKLLLTFVFALIGIVGIGILWAVVLILKGVFWVILYGLIPFLRATVVRFVTMGIAYLQHTYPKVVGYTLKNRLNAITLVVIPTVFAFFYILPRIGSELIPQVHQGEFNVELQYAVGTPVEKTAAQLLEIESEIKKLDGVQSVSSRSGVDKAATTKAEEGEHTAKISVLLKPTDDVKAAEERIINDVRKVMSTKSGLTTKITRNEIFTFKTPVEVFIKGFNLEKLRDYSRQAVSKIAEVSGIADVKSNIQTGKPEVQIIYDRERLARFGLNSLQVANVVRNKILGDVSTRFRETDRRIDITVLLQDQYKQNIDDLKRIVVNSGGQNPILLSSVASITLAEGPSEIRRENQERTAVITANVSGDRDLASIINEIDGLMADIDFDGDFFYEMAGQNKEMETSINSLIAALMLAVFLVYIIMASQFESFIHPFVILFSIPLALVGVFIALYFTGFTLSIMSYLGMIMLAGIVVNNAIVLVSHINLLREQGMEKEAAIIEGGRVRLRPILMTTATTVLGLTPMAFGLGDGAEMRQPMAVTVIAGLISSTVLTLVIIPTLYAIFDRDPAKPEIESDFSENLDAGIEPNA